MKLLKLSFITDTNVGDANGGAIVIKFLSWSVTHSEIPSLYEGPQRLFGRVK